MSMNCSHEKFILRLECCQLCMYDLGLLQVLHAGKTNKNSFKALIAAEYNGVEVKLVPDFEMGVSNKTPEFIKMNPIGKVAFYFDKLKFVLLNWSCLLD